MRQTRKAVGILLIFLGLILVGTPLFYEWKQNQEVAAIEKALSIISEPQAGQGAAGLPPIRHLSLSETELEKVMELKVPSIDLEQIVLPETTEENLSISLTQIKPDQTPGQGNFTIAGHRGYRGGRHFRDLPDVPIGAEVYLYHGKKRYTYVVKSQEIIEATAIDVLDDQANVNEITLITCTLDGKRRIALKGELVVSEPMQ